MNGYGSETRSRGRADRLSMHETSVPAARDLHRGIVDGQPILSPTHSRAAAR
jgi:hypothetical protein